MHVEFMHCISGGTSMPTCYFLYSVAMLLDTSLVVFFIDVG